MNKPNFLGIHANPNKGFALMISLIPFIIAMIFYFGASHIRLKKNPNDKILPSISKMADSTKNYTYSLNKRTKEYESKIFSDTYSTLKRIFLGMILSAFVGLFVGLVMGIFPGLEALNLNFISTISIIPPLAILPILLISFGTGELGKVMLIFLGTCPLIIRDMYSAVKKTPDETLTKALTLGASSFDLTFKIILPQMIPKLIETVRLSLGAAWVYLISAESIAADSGLGYRIFLVRRYLAMDVIIPYVIWITLIGFLIDFSLKKIVQYKYPWYAK